MNEDKTKKKRTIIIAVIALIIVIAIVVIAITNTVTRVTGDGTKNLSTLKVSSDGTYELSVVNYLSSDVGEQNFMIQKTDEYSNPLQGVEFEIVGDFRTSYSVEYLKASDDEGINFDKLDEYTQIFYESCWDERYYITDNDGQILLTLQYGDYVVRETDELYGYDKNDTNYCLRINEDGIFLIDEEDISWEDPDFDEESVLRVRTASIEDQIGNIGGVEIDYIEINGEKIGTEINDLPENVFDEDIIKIYLKQSEEELSYTVNFFGQYESGIQGGTSIRELDYIDYNNKVGTDENGKYTYVNWDKIEDAIIDNASLIMHSMGYMNSATSWVDYNEYQDYEVYFILNYDNDGLSNFWNRYDYLRLQFPSGSYLGLQEEYGSNKDLKIYDEGIVAVYINNATMTEFSIK